jgi:hypothetical protein
MGRSSARQSILRLFEIRNRFGQASADEKGELLDTIAGSAVRTAADARRLHLVLCFLRAFPDTVAVYRRATALLARFPRIVDDLSERERARLTDSGIAGTELNYPFSYEVAHWLARAHPGVACIDWSGFENAGRFDELLSQLLEYTETDYFDSGYVTTDEWLAIASGRSDDGGFAWLMSQLADLEKYDRFWTAMYNAAEVPVLCRLGSSKLSRTNNVYPCTKVRCRTSPMRARVANAKREICRPIDDLQHLDARAGARLIDVAMSSLAARHRETNHFNHANPKEVYVANVGAGVRIAVTGLLAEHRYPLETTMGFLILSNDIPVGYGGSSAFYRQTNTGINIFEEFRGSEAAWFWVQVMRTIHQLTGCNRFVANPYQFGADNTEALKSGAFWFYYRLGYRPVRREARALAAAEFRRVKSRKGYRTPLETLKALSACDMHLKLPGARDADFFDEGWIEFAGLLATRKLVASGQRSRRRGRKVLAGRLLQSLSIASLSDWSAEERDWFERLAPVVSALEPDQWTASERRQLTKWLRTKGGRYEREFALCFAGSERVFAALKSACRRVAREH